MYASGDEVMEVSNRSRPAGDKLSICRGGHLKKFQIDRLPGEIRMIKSFAALMADDVFIAGS